MLSCNTEPHFTTIAHFISGYPQSISSLFEQILLICDEQGLLGHELFAIGILGTQYIIQPLPYPKVQSKTSVVK